MQRGLLIGVCLVAGLALVNSAGKWSYVGKTGPAYWHELFPEACSGDKQSPIDLKREQTMYNPGLKDFAIWYDPPRPDSRMYIKNTGYTVQVDLEGDFFVTNAGLGHVYKAVQFHFHWGHKSHQGSEHLLDGQASPIELHVVTYNNDLYSDIGEAVTQPGGLAVLGVLFEISKEDNPNFDYIVRGMRQIKNPEKLAKIELPLFSLRNLLPDDISRYFRYNGSLTTPGCFESVIWTVFDQMQGISRKQMEHFRTLLEFKRKHHHHKHHEKHNRQRRELTAEQKKKENNANGVLDEIGVNGKDSEFERKVLRDELQNANNEAMSEVVNMTEGGDGAPIEYKKEPDVFVQNYIVNNFRPAQPLNGRIVSRSFKLGEVVMVQGYDTKAVVVDSPQQVKACDNKDHNAAKSISFSITLILTSLCAFTISHLY